MIAYACDPEGWGEHWLGWGWALQAATEYEVHLITSDRNVESLARHAPLHGIHLYPIKSYGMNDERRSKLGKVKSLLSQQLWQKAAYALALRLHREAPFALVHQTTFHTFRIPFLCSMLPIPSVWGPIAGGERVPRGFMGALGKTALLETIRQWLNRPTLYLPSIRSSFRRADAIWVSNRVTYSFLPKAFRGKMSIVSPNALRPDDVPLPPLPPPGKCLNLLYMGNCVASRAIPLVLDALLLDNTKKFCHLKIIGTGAALDAWKAQVKRHGLEAHVTFAGQVPAAEVNQHYQQADALIFPGLRDSGGSSILEAMARGLPIICFDCNGPPEMLGAHGGIKIPVSNPQETIRALAQAFRRLASEPALKERLAEGSLRAAQEGDFTWERKRALLLTTYERLIGPSTLPLGCGRGPQPSHRT